MNSPKRLARIAGFLSLLVGLFGGFVDPKMYVAGNPAATAANAGLVSMGRHRPPHSASTQVRL